MPLIPRYDTIGSGYAGTRREDARIAAHIRAALGESRSVLNLGAGTGSYEPTDLWGVSVEPSSVMCSQRASDRFPVVRGTAGRIPLADNAVDAAMTVLSLHHWDQDQERGVHEMRRVARGPVAIVTIDPVVSGAMWLMADYLHEVRDMDLEIFPSPERVASWLGPGATVEAIPVHRDSPDWSLVSFWAHPERVLDDAARHATSGFARQSAEVNARVVQALARDLESGAWNRRYGHLRTEPAFDAGLRLVTLLR